MHDIGPQGLHHRLGDLSLLPLALYEQQRRLCFAAAFGPRSNIHSPLVSPRPDLNDPTVPHEELSRKAFELSPIDPI